MSTNAHSDCERIAQDLPAYLYSDLSDAERDAVESHIAACRTCAAEEAGFREVKEILELAPPPMPLTGDLAARVMARASAQAGGGEERRRVFPLWAKAAIVIFAFALGLLSTTMLPGGSTLEAFERMVARVGDDAQQAETVEQMLCDELGVGGRPHVDPFAPKISHHQVMAVDRHYQVLVDKVEKKSRILAAFFQLRKADWYRTRPKDLELAGDAYRKVLDFVDEGPLAEKARKHLDEISLGQPESH